MSGADPVAQAGANQLQKDSFPAYSPDINRPIEKAWRELQRRYMRRAASISSRAQMIRAIQEEWAGLEFERTEHWCGINYLVERYHDVLRSVIEEKGYDTEFMK